jgi:glycosyltransferase involved in cell wall biosynthesis/GT2 family glycosyltransferase
MKIAVYTITKNEEQFISRWADSCKEADYRLVVDTGSSDNTIETAKLAGCHISNIAVSPWRFDDARNAALMLLPEDVDYCIALDADEILMPGWRESLEKVDLSVTRPRYKYVWSWTADGEEGLTYSGDKIHARKGYKWTHPVHEVITPLGTEVQGWTDLQIHHHPDPTKSRSQYLPLLELAVEELPDDDRNRFYLGRELMFNGRNDEAKVHLERHLELSTWAPERATSMRYLGRVTDNKEHWNLRACAEAPYRREPWVDLARFYYETGNWPGCYFASQQALKITEKPLEYLCEEEAWGSLPHDLASIAAWQLGKKEESITHGTNAIKFAPGDKRLLQNVSMVYRDLQKSNVFAVVPTKSNFEGAKNTVRALLNDPAVKNIAVICEIPEAKASIVAAFPEEVRSRVIPIGTDEGLGIQHMWNEGLDTSYGDLHVLFINDDTTVDGIGISAMSGFLDLNPDIGLVCPNYDGRISSDTFIETRDTCRGRYDGTGGLGGFCMMLSSDLAKKWQFDESMIWWYGDDDLLNWVWERGKRAGIFVPATAVGNESWTINNDPPKDFAKVVENDRSIFEKKWNK